MEKTEDLKKKWIKFYPSYIDKGLKYSEGRKVASSIAIDNPTAREIFIICGEYLKLDCAEDPKHHPQDWMKRGRVLVNVKQSQEIKKKTELLKLVAQEIKEARSKVVETTTEDGEKKRRKKKK